MAVQARLTHNIDSIRKSMQKIPDEARQEIKGWITDLAVWIKDELKSRVPVKTGTLQRSIRYTTDYRGADEIRVNFYWEWYGDILDNGSQAKGIIYPTSAKVFKFTIGGSTVYSKWVDHKGMKGKDWSGAVFDVAEVKAGDIGDKIQTYLLGLIPNE